MTNEALDAIGSHEEIKCVRIPFGRRGSDLVRGRFELVHTSVDNDVDTVTASRLCESRVEMVPSCDVVWETTYFLDSRGVDSSDNLSIQSPSTHFVNFDQIVADNFINPPSYNISRDVGENLSANCQSLSHRTC